VAAARGHWAGQTGRGRCASRRDGDGDKDACPCVLTIRFPRLHCCSTCGCRKRLCCLCCPISTVVACLFFLVYPPCSSSPLDPSRSCLEPRGGRRRSLLPPPAPLPRRVGYSRARAITTPRRCVDRACQLPIPPLRPAARGANGCPDQPLPLSPHRRRPPPAPPRRRPRGRHRRQVGHGARPSRLCRPRGPTRRRRGRPPGRGRCASRASAAAVRTVAVPGQSPGAARQSGGCGGGGRGSRRRCVAGGWAGGVGGRLARCGWTFSCARWVAQPALFGGESHCEKRMASVCVLCRYE